MWDGVDVESKIESVGEVCETEWPNVLKVSDANANNNNYYYYYY